MEANELLLATLGEIRLRSKLVVKFSFFITLTVLQNVVDHAQEHFNIKNLLFPLMK